MLIPFSNKRLVSGLIAGIVGLIAVLLGGWWFTALVGLIVHLALLEFFRMAEFTGIRPATKTTLVACQLLLFATQWGNEGFITSELSSAILPLSGAAICGWIILQPETGSIADIAASIFGLFYLGFLPSHWIKLRNFSDLNAINSIDISNHFSDQIPNGMTITLVSCLIIVASDIGSYFLGRAFGRHSLSPISPSKTIEGAFGGIFCAILIGAIAGEVLQWNQGILIWSFLGFLIALFALVGDLTESIMKRNAGLKDSGDALPGHGGILDRIDSYLFTPAIIYYLIRLILPFLSS